MKPIGIATLLATLLLALLDVGCAGPRYAASPGRSSARRGESRVSMDLATDSDESSPVSELSGLAMGSGGGEATSTVFEDDAELYAQAETQPQTTATATDAVDTSRELLIYTAVFHVGVYDVEASAASVAESARAIGGFVQQEADDRIIVRVPAARFRAFVTTIEGVGDILHREVEAQDVGEEFRDVEIRIRNLEQVRDQVAALLQRGLSVEQVLVVERELERVTAELESLRGRQRYLADRISYSTVTVLFREAPRDQIDQPEIFQLPFSWLDSLGLPNLLTLR